MTPAPNDTILTDVFARSTKDWAQRTGSFAACTPTPGAANQAAP